MKPVKLPLGIELEASSCWRQVEILPRLVIVFKPIADDEWIVSLEWLFWCVWICKPVNHPSPKGQGVSSKNA